MRKEPGWAQGPRRSVLEPINLDEVEQNRFCAFLVKRNRAQRSRRRRLPGYGHGDLGLSVCGAGPSAEASATTHCGRAITDLPE